MAENTEPRPPKAGRKGRRTRRGAAQFESHPIPGAVIANDAPAPGKKPRAAADGEMWALVYDTKKDPWQKTKGFRKARVPRPLLDEQHDPLDANRAIVRVLYTGVCGSDAGIWFRTSFKGMIHDSLKAEGKTTRVIGHEVFGEVAEVGSHARAHFGLKKGDLVAAESHIVCGKCHQCLIGQTHVCANERIIGISRDGGFAEYIKLPATVLWKTDPRKIRKEVAAIQEPFGNAVHASTAVDLRGKSLAIFGCGAIGQFTILIARALGAAKIIGVEPDPRNAALARKLGADEVVEFKPRAGKDDWKANPEVVERVVAFSGIDGVEVGMEMAGYNSSVNNALHSVRRGGEVVLFGLRSGHFKIQDFSRVIVKGITIRNVIGRRLFETWEITKNLLESRENHIQSKIWNVMLQRGKDTVVNIADFDPAVFEKKIKAHPKILIRWG
jgi:threonine 3-dehydrogenase